jgi:hypothetical protein
MITTKIIVIDEQIMFRLKGNHKPHHITSRSVPTTSSTPTATTAAEQQQQQQEQQQQQ